MRLKLNNITTGTKAKMLQTDQGIFVCNVEPDFNNFEVDTGNRDNRYGLWDDTKDVLLKNIYNINDFSRRSYVNTTKQTEGINPLDVFGPETPYTSITQFNNVAVGLTSLSNLGVTFKRWNEVQNVEEYVSHENTVIVYPPSGQISAVFENLEPQWILSGVDFNFMEESPVEFQYYDYATGVMYSNSMNMKNMYNNQWDVGSNVVSSEPLSTTSGTLDNSRYYIDINSDGNQLIYDVYRNQNSYDALSTDVYPKQA